VGDTFLVFVIFMLAMAVATRDSFIFILFYLVGGAYLFGQLWSKHSLASIAFKRKFPQRIFLGEEIKLELEITNKSRLPAVWLRLQESLPVEIATGPIFQLVLTLAPNEKVLLSYSLWGRKRGYYPIGPLQLSSGDLLGMGKEKEYRGEADFIIVYPRVIPLSGISLPSHSPIGTLRYRQPIFEDPNRPVGKRDYQTGDSLRRIDWKASASVGRLQVKQYEASIELQTAIFLNLNMEEYHYKTRFDAVELAIVTAASISNWAIAHKQSVGLTTNGNDPLGENGYAQPFPVHKGRGHLIRILESLARIKAVETHSITDLIRQHRVNLTWGATMVVITGQADRPLFDEFFRAQRVGMDVVLILCGPIQGLQEIRQQARQFNIPVFGIHSETDLERWHKAS
jgi:uncharacterized protein (DUF58 family)